METNGERWFIYAKWALNAMALLNLALGCGLFGLGQVGWTEYFETDGRYPAAFYVIWPFALGCVGWMPGTLQLLAAWGVARGSRLAWGFALFVAFMNLFSCNLPFSVVILYGLLADPVTRSRFLDPR